MGVLELIANFTWNIQVPYTSSIHVFINVHFKWTYYIQKFEFFKINDNSKTDI